MFNFDYYNPTHIVFGKDRLGDLDKLVPANARVLITYGGGSAKKSGLLAKVAASLGKRHVVEFGGIEPNPKYETAIKAVGVPQDWATHMIGHELTAQFGIDHGQTLAVVYPSLLEIRRDKKKAKLVQYAERVWNLTTGTDDQKITAAIAKTREFFESLGIKTRLSAYGVKRDQIGSVVQALKDHGMTKLSETGDLTLDISEKILVNAF